MLDFGNYYSDYTDGYSISTNGLDSYIGTVAPELPTDYGSTSADYTGTTVQPSVSEVPRSDGISVTGVLNSVTAGAKSLVDIWGSYNQITNSIDNAKFQQSVTEAKLDLAKVQTMGAIDVAKAQSAGTVAIEKARTQLAVANEVTRVNSGGGSTASAGISLSMMVTIGLAIYAFTKKGKA